MSALAALQERAGALAPMGVSNLAPILHGRTLYIDGDGLAYYCAGNDETLLGEARQRTADKVQSALRASQAEKLVILLTGSGSHKGHRYAVARVKAYQGQRANSRRPANWRGLRDLLEAGVFGEPRIYMDREADDGFAEAGHADPEGTVIMTQDKDMRMVPGWHLDWVDNRMRYLAPNVFGTVMNDLWYGEKWFWRQMLWGDGADFIPGIPWYMPQGGKKLARCAEVTSADLLADCHDRASCAERVAEVYRSYYKERYLVEMLEQAVLLWMRKDPKAHWFDVAAVGNPLFYFYERPEHFDAWKEINQRVQEAIDLNSLPPQD